MCVSLTDLFADGDTGRERSAVNAGELVLLNNALVRHLAVNGLGASLQDHEVAGDAVLGPLDIHRLVPAGELGIVLLDLAGPVCELQDLKAGETKSVALRGDDVADLGP